MNALDLMLSTQWAMSRDPLELMLRLAQDRGADRLANALESGATDPHPEWCTWAERTQEYRAILLSGGSKLEGSRRAVVRDGVAMVPLLGPTFRRANLLTEVSGATSLEGLAKDLTAAVANPEVKAILLDVDSPGGEVNGTAELAAHIVAMNRKKPMCAYVGGTCASAAYWLASACGSIVLSSTALVGSIGVLGTFRRADAESVTIVSSQSPNKRPDLETEGGRAEVQRTLDALAGIFVSNVAKHRAVSEKTVLSDFGAGGLLVGSAAVAAGMADRVGTLEATLKALAQDPYAMPGRRKRAEAEGEVCAEDDLTLQGEAPAAKPFEDELNALLASADGSIARAREIHARRQEDGRALSAARRQQLLDLRDRFTVLLEETEPRATAEERVRLAVQAQAIEAEALSHSVAVLLRR